MEDARISRPGGRAVGAGDVRAPMAVLVAVAALLGVAAVASRAPLTNAPARPAAVALPGDGAYLGPPPLAITLFAIGGGVALTGLYMYGRLRAKLRASGAGTRGATPMSVRLALALVFVLLGAGIVVLAIVGSHHKKLQPAVRGHRPDLPPSVVRAFSVPGWLPYTVVGVALAGGGLLLLGGGLRRGPDPEAQESADVALRRALEQSIAELSDDPDPRRAVIAAYARMEGALARAGHPRRRSEAPREYLSRVLAVVTMPPGPVRRLTGLFERARFSEHLIDPTLRGEALSALCAIRDGLGEPA